MSCGVDNSTRNGKMSVCPNLDGTVTCQGFGNTHCLMEKIENLATSKTLQPSVYVVFCREGWFTAVFIN